MVSKSGFDDLNEVLDALLRLESHEVVASFHPDHEISQPELTQLHPVDCVMLLLLISERAKIGKLNAISPRWMYNFPMLLAKRLLERCQGMILAADIQQIINNIREVKRWRKFLRILRPVVARFVAAEGLTKEWAQAIDEILLDVPSRTVEELDLDNQMVLKLHRLRYGADTKLPPFCEPWQLPFRRDELHDINVHAYTLRAQKPNREWRVRAKSILANVNVDEFHKAFADSITVLQGWDGKSRALVTDHLKGLCWIVSLTDHSDELLGDMMFACASIEWSTPEKSAKGFNACLSALIEKKSSSSLAKIVRCSQMLEKGQSQRKLAAELPQISNGLGIELDRIDELLPPDFGLSKDGRSVMKSSEHEAQICIEDLTVSVTWSRHGKPFKANTATMAGPDAPLYTIVVATTKRIESCLRKQAARLEESYLRHQTWTLSDWSRLYREHGLLRQLGDALVWQITGNETVVSFMSTAAGLVDSSGQILEGISESAVVSLWHPCQASEADRKLWQDRVIESKIVQPFRQVFRESYDRRDCPTLEFCASVVRGATVYLPRDYLGFRGWRHEQLEGGSQRTNVLETELGPFDVRIDCVPLSGEEYRGYVPGHHLLGSLAVLTRKPSKLVTELSEVVLSEVARAAEELISHLGAIETAESASDNSTLRKSPAFSPSALMVTQVGQNRRLALSRVLHLLPFAKSLILDETYLHVRGKLRHYSIHLESGAVTFGAGECAVPMNKLKTSRRYYLPHADDKVLIAILEKARILSADDKIRNARLLEFIVKPDA